LAQRQPTSHVRDSDTTFKVKRSKVDWQGRGILWRPPAQLVCFIWQEFHWTPW